jgi:hypothetical protein
MIGNGVTLLREYSDGSYLPVAGVISLTPPSLSRETIELHEMGADSKTHLPGLKDAGEIALEVNFFDAELESGETQSGLGTSSHAPIYRDFKDGRVVRYLFQFPDGTNWLCRCIVTSFAISTPAGDRITASLSLKLAGAPVFGHEPALGLQTIVCGPPTATVIFADVVYETDGTPVTVYEED